jgi:DNA-binding transcriptional LysR family regulator
VINVRRLRFLREVALQGSVTAAARSLSFTPSAVSQQIAALEREVGLDLLERHGRGVRLTDAAQALLGPADVILAELRRAEATLADITASTAGTLSVGAFPTSGTWLVPAALRQFAEQGTAVDVRLAELEPEQSLPMLRRGDLDLAIAFECDLVPLDAGAPHEERTLFWEDMLLLQADEATPKRRSLDLATLRHSAWIAPHPETAIHRLTVRACQAAGFEPRISSTWTDFQVVQSLVSQHLGVAFVPELALTPQRRGVFARRVSPGLRRRVFAAWQAGTSRQSLIHLMVEAFAVVSTTRKPGAPPES